MATRSRRIGLRILVFLLTGLASMTLGCGAVARPVAGLEARFQAVLERAAADPSIPGVAASVRAPGVDWRGAAGLRTRGDAAPLDADDTFRIASITKVFVAATIFRLIEENSIGLYDPISAHASRNTLDALRAAGYDPDRITIRHLLTHTSGLADYASSPDYVAAVMTDLQRRWSRADQVLFAMRSGAPVAAPGARFHYADTGYVILGEIVERRAELPLAAAFRRYLRLRTLGLSATWLETLESVPPGARARAHQYFGDADVTNADPSFDLYGGGGLVSTVDDLTRFIRALFKGRVFERRETMAAALMAPDVAYEAGARPHAALLGAISIGDEDCWGHDGFWGASVAYCPHSDAAIAVTVNQAWAAAPGAARRVQAELAAALP